MNSSLSRCEDDPARVVAEAVAAHGAYRHGIARAEAVDDASMRDYTDWIGHGCHAGMEYLAKYDDVRRDPRLLLKGARSLIVCAFPYARPVRSEPGYLRVASYALGDDYHDVIRRRLGEAAREIDEALGSVSRVCVDTAPLRERYWAVRSGLGYIGLNDQLILPGAGSYFFIGTIVTTADLTPHEPCRMKCIGCRRCIACCPSGALTADPKPKVDARRCLSCLTIEHRGPFGEPPPRLDGRLYGCDTCQLVCPHNRVVEGMLEVEPLPEFQPRPELLQLTRERIADMTPEEYHQLFRGSAMRRCKLPDLKRNASTP